MPMWKRTVLIGAGALALVISAACSNSGYETPMAQAPASATGPTTTAPSGEAFNHADVMFARHMIPHHEQAIEMSDILLAKQDVDPRVIAMANQIKAAQLPEIQQMRGWLNQWGVPPMPGMPSGHMNMPGHGMMSGDEVSALKNAQGVEASKLFLTQMIEHHEGAITMAQNEIDTGQYPPELALAGSIVTSQRREIDIMKDILSTL